MQTRDGSIEEFVCHGQPSKGCANDDDIQWLFVLWHRVRRMSSLQENERKAMLSDK